MIHWSSHEFFNQLVSFATVWISLRDRYDKVLILLKNHMEAIESVYWKAELQNFLWTSYLEFISILYLKKFG